MFIQKNTKKAVKANTRKVRRAVRAAEEEVVDEVVEEAGEGEVDVAPEASDLLFEAEDVAELIAEVTSEDVAVTVDEDTVTFEIGDDEFTVEAEGNEEILESTRKPLKRKGAVKASRNNRVNKSARTRRATRR